MRGTRAEDLARRNGGVSLIEVMIAVAILGSGMLTLAAMQLAALQQGSMGRFVTEATAIADDQMDQVRRMPWGTVTASTGNGWEDPPWINIGGFAAGDIPVSMDVTGGGTDTVQVYNVDWRVTAVVGNTNLRNVDIEVSWTDPNMGNARPTRSGQPTVALSSVRYNW